MRQGIYLVSTIFKAEKNVWSLLLDQNGTEE